MHSVEASQIRHSGTDTQENSLLAVLDRREVTPRQQAALNYQTPAEL